MSLRRIKLIVWDRIIGYGVTWTYPFDNGKLYETPIYQLSIDGIDSQGKLQNYWFPVFRFGVTRNSKESEPYVVGLSDHQTHVIKRWIPTYSPHSSPSTEIGAWQVYDSFLIHDGPDYPRNPRAFATIGCIEVCSPGGFNLFNDILIQLSGSKKSSRDSQLSEIGFSGQVIITYIKAERPQLKEVGII